ncbi:MAG: PKD domain-containing protein [Marmoricola sp.]
MRKISALISVAVVSVLLALVPASPGTAASVGNSHPQTGRIVSDDPANFTPHILDGTVYSIVQVGDMVVVGGSFSQVRSATSTTVLTRRNLVAFDATTGAISTDFVPNPNSTVYKVQAAMDGESVYVGGRFSSAFGVSMPSRLFKANVAEGTRDPVFRPATFSGDIRDLEVINNRLWVAGKFTHIGGVAQKALGTINATTGTKDNFFTGVFAGTHRDPTVYTGDRTNVLQISSNPANNRLVAVGNFTSVNGTTRSQIVQLDISGTTATISPWYTTLFTSSCSRNFETIMTDVEYSPNGSFFIVSTTAAWGGMSSAYGGNGCDVVARFESGSTSSSSVATWTAYTGGDSTWTVEVTDNVVYAGGHQSWQNNPIGANRAAQGAVSRPGIAGLNAVNGMAWSWNPTRTRGVGVQDMLATEQGLWVGSDTDRIGAYEYHSNIALMPLAGGKTLPVMSNPTLPATIYNVGTTGSTLNRRDFNGTTATPPLPVTTVPATNVPSWGTTVGAFMSNGVLYTAASNGQVTKRTFNGTAYGPPSPVNTADLLVTQTDWHNTDVPSLTSLFFYNGEIFFTRSGQTTMFRRGFEPESDIVGQQRFTVAAVSGVNYTTMRGAFVADNKLYWSNTSGQLFRADWAGRGPVAGTAQQVLTAGTGWNSRALFAFGGVATPPTNQPPVADATVTCNGLTCTFDGSDSDDPDGQIETWAWNFGDPNQTGSGETTTHTYPTAGPRTISLTVTDDDGASHTVQRQINPSVPVNQVPVADAAVTCVGLTCTFDGSDSDDPDGDIDTWEWDFGDPNATGSGETTTHTYPTPGPRTVTLTVTDDDNATDTDTVQINPTVPVNQPPVAAFTVDCDQLVCTFDGTDSDDPDGTVDSYVWDFGDGATDEVSGANATHTYAAAGPVTVKLTVTDDDGAPDDAEQNINPSDVESPVEFIGAASTVGNREQHIVTIPAAVEAGDALLLFFAANTTTPSYTGPTGWTQIGTTSGGGTAGRAYSKVATAADAATGATVRVVSSGYAKSQISIAAYRGTDATTPVAASASAQDAGGTSHTSPVVTAPAGSRWLVTYWADESTNTSGWTIPASQTERNTLSHSGSGHMSGVVADSNSDVAGSTGGLVATSNSASSRGVSFSVVLR